MAFALVTSAQGQNTTASADTTGANLIVLCTGLNTLGTISDSKGNTWTKLTTRSGSSIATAIYYCYAPTVGSGHTFTMANAVGAIVMEAFSGSASTPFDVENGAATDTNVTTLGTGSITPSVNDTLIVAALGAGKTNQSHSLDSGMTVAQSINGVASTRYGAAIGYKIQTTAAAISPVWTWTNAGEVAVAVAAFKSATGGGGGLFVNPLSGRGGAAARPLRY